MRKHGFTLGVGAAAVAAMLVHMRSLRAPFFADDWLFLDQVRFRSFAQVLASPDPLGNFFRPLGRQVWFWLLANLSGESPLVFHAANLLTFFAAVVLLPLIGTPATARCSSRATILRQPRGCIAAQRHRPYEKREPVGEDRLAFAIDLWRALPDAQHHHAGHGHATALLEAQEVESRGNLSRR